jgi:hypothetical protein
MRFTLQNTDNKDCGTIDIITLATFFIYIYIYILLSRLPTFWYLLPISVRLVMSLPFLFVAYNQIFS